MTHQQALSMIEKHKLIAILRSVPLEDSLNVAKALYQGGVRVLEFTFDHNQPDFIRKTTEQVQLIREAFGSEMLIGCGTVLTTEEVDAAIQAGAQLIISPTVDQRVIHRTRELDAISMPGAMTPTEIVTAYETGADIVKLFPAGALGAGYIKALRAPLCHIPISAVGGITPQNVGDFLTLGVCGLGIGSEMVRKHDVDAHNWQAITDRAAEFVQAIARWEAQQ